MARKRRKYIRGSVDETLTPSALAGRTLVSADFDNTVNERTLVSSIEAIWQIDDLTLAADEGPLMVGLAHSDYSDAEIEAVVENLGSWDEGDLVSQELNRRKVRMVGIFGHDLSGPSGVDVLNDGIPVKTKLNWILNQGQTLSVWAYNLGTNPIATTVPNIHVEGHANLWPR